MASVSPFAQASFLVGSGLNVRDAAELLEPGEAAELINFVSIGRGRVAPRKAASLVSAVPGTILGVEAFPHGAYSYLGQEQQAGVAILTLNGGAVQLYLANDSGKNPSLVGNLAGWAPVGADKFRISTAVVNRKLFVTDVAKVHGLTVFDPFYYEVDSGSYTPTLYQPSFAFNQEFSPGKMLPRVLAVYNNFLFSAGYGDQNEPSRPEVVRFSYLGLQNDGEGSGDAGYISDELNDPPVATPTEAAQNLNLFDREDYFMVGERGTPVVAMAAALGRLIICTPNNAWVLFGYERERFQLELLDNTKGCTGSSAMVGANGLVYWWSPVGPVVWNGSGVEEIGQKIYPEIDKLNPENVVAAHARRESQIRFYQGNKGFAYNYKTQEWSRIVLPTDMDVWCAGFVSPFSSTSTGVAGPRPGPAGPPVDLENIDVTTNSAVSIWESGDTSPAVLTEVYRKKTSDASWPDNPVATLPSSYSRFAHSGLEMNTSYDVRVRHLRGPLVSSYATASFTTLDRAVLPPQRFVAVTDPTQMGTWEDDAGGGTSYWLASVVLRWGLGIAGARTEIYRVVGNPVGPERTDLETYELVATTNIDSTTYRDGGSLDFTSLIVAGGQFTYTARHYARGIYSEIATPVTVTVLPEKPQPPRPPSDPTELGFGGEWGGIPRHLSYDEQL